MPTEASAATADAVAAAVAAVNGMKAAEGRGGNKKSAAFFHTRLYGLETDALGKEFERRACCYCDAVFSFKNGTTSAALRHLRSAHPDRDLTALPEDSGEVFQQAEWQQMQAAEGAVGRVPDTEAARNGDGDGPSASNAAVEDSTASMNVLDVGEGELVMVEEVEAEPSTPTDEEANYNAQTERELRSILKRKRESESFDMAAAKRTDFSVASETASAASGLSTPQLGPLQPQPSAQTIVTAVSDSPRRLTASQMAIKHVMQHYKDALPVLVRLQLAKHLTRHVDEAEMYNVLDDDTREAYIHEFAATVSGGSGARTSRTSTL